MVKEIGGVIGAIGTAYLSFDFFFWDGGILDPSILSLINDVGMVLIV